MSDTSSENRPERSQTQVDIQLGETDVLSGVRHNLRTPLNQIIGYSEMLQEDLADLGQENLLPDLQKIRTAGGQLLALINEGLAAWKVEAGRIDLDTMRLEMRMPLNLIIGYAELSREMVEESTNQRIASDLQKIVGAAHNLLALFNSQSFPSQIQVNARKGAPTEASGEEVTEEFNRPAALAPAKVFHGSILVIDDNEMNRDMLARRLERTGHKVSEAENGLEGLSMLKNGKFDLVLLDVLMPVMNGFETLQQIKEDAKLKHLPIIMISAMDEVDAAVSCIEAGAEDYLPKPFNPILLKARISACLEKKYLRDSEMEHMAQLRVEREKSDRLLHCILPKAIADRLKNGETTIADTFDEATVLFVDIVDFQTLSKQYLPERMVQLLNDLFSGFDWLVDMHGMERIRTLGDAYMAVSGIPAPHPEHGRAALDVALEMLRITKRFNSRNGVDFKVRIGLSSGPVMAGIVGRKKFLYYVWGPTVNIARDLETSSLPDCIHVDSGIRAAFRQKYIFQDSAHVVVAGNDRVSASFLTGKMVK